MEDLCSASTTFGFSPWRLPRSFISRTHLRLRNVIQHGKLPQYVLLIYFGSQVPVRAMSNFRLAHITVIRHDGVMFRSEFWVRSTGTNGAPTNAGTVQQTPVEREAPEETPQGPPAEPSVPEMHGEILPTEEPESGAMDGAEEDVDAVTPVVQQQRDTPALATRGRRGSRRVGTRSRTGDGRSAGSTL